MRLFQALRKDAVEPTGLAALLAARRIDCVVDAGGDGKRFGAALFGGGYRGQLISAEEELAAWRALKLRAGSSGRFWSVLPPMRLGDRHGDAPRGDGSAVAVRRLDDLMELGSLAARIFLRIGDASALDGAAEALREGRVAGVQAAGADVAGRLESMSFRRVDLPGEEAIYVRD